MSADRLRRASELIRRAVEGGLGRGMLMHPAALDALADLLQFHADALDGMDAVSVADPLARAILREPS